MRNLLFTLIGASFLSLGACESTTGSGVTADVSNDTDSQIADSVADATTDDSSSSSCTVGSDTCGANAFCSAPLGQCGGNGTCTARPAVCPQICGAFCGCDGKDYCSECIANGAGVVLAHSGSCATDKWYTTCGLPVCGVTPTVDPFVPKCTTQKDGDPCTAGAAECDLQNDCGQHLVCTDKDPKVNPGGCPISRRSRKTDIRYLDASDAAKLQAELLATKLATYKYRDAGPQAPQQLGFIIDDQPDSPAVDARRDMVDLYGYLSMSVAAIQTQQRQLAEQARRIEQLENALRESAICQ